MSNDVDRFSLLELDGPSRQQIPDAAEAAIELDLVDSAIDPDCVDCGDRAPVDDNGRCRACWELRTSAGQSAGIAADFGNVIAEASTNASARLLADDAVGRATFGVGYRDAAGYIEALRRGAPQRSLDEYAEILRSRYGYQVEVVMSENRTAYSVKLDKAGEDVQAFQAGVLAASGYETGVTAEVDSHASDDGIAALKARSVARRAAEAKVKAETDAQKVLPTGEVEDTGRVVLRHGDLVAGASADGHGILVGWCGQGPLTHARIVELAKQSGLPEAWYPTPREASTQARRAVQAFASAQLTCYTEDRGRKWRLERPATNAKPGEKSGDVALLATLVDDTKLECDGDGTLTVQIAAEFKRLVDEQRYDAGDVTVWIVSVLRGKLAAVKYGGNWYVPRRNRDLANALCTTFAAAWGREWIMPPLPIATTAQLAQGLANGLTAEIEEIVSGIEEDRAKAQGKGKDMGDRAAASYQEKLRKASERVVAYGQILGDRLVAGCRDRIRKAMLGLDEILDDGISQRFVAVWDEIEFDIKNKGGIL